MEKKILIAVDDSRHSENALRYAASLHETVNDSKFVLFHVQPTISQYLLDEARTKPGANAALKKLMQKNHQAAEALLEKHHALLTSQGVPDADVEQLTLPRKSGVAKDIMDYSTVRQYDAVLLGPARALRIGGNLYRQRECQCRRQLSIDSRLAGRRKKCLQNGDGRR